MDIGNVIKNARINKKLTQESLANALGISIQAVSRWETGVSYPDITMIPAIANYLNITADQLFSINLEERKQTIQKILDLDDEYTKKFDLKSSMELLENSLKQYPNDEYLLQRITRNYHNQICLMKENNIEKEQEIRKKIIENSLKVLEIAKDDEIRMRAKIFLCWTYSNFGLEGITKAKEIANKMASIFYAKEVLLADVLTGEEKKNQIKELLENYLRLIIKETGIRIVNSLDDINQKIIMYKKSIDLIKIIIGDNLYDYNRKCSNFSLKIAKCYAITKDKENAIYYLNESTRYAKEYNAIPNEGVYDSFWLENCKWKKIVTKPLDININSFNDKCFDFIKDSEDFINMIKEFEEENK